MFAKLIKSSIVLILSTVFTKALIFFVNVFLARTTSQDMYGQYALIRSLVNMAETTVSSSINPLVIKETSSEDKNVSLIRTTILLHAVFFNILLVVLGYCFSDTIISLLNVNYNNLVIVLTSFLVGIMILNGILTSIFIAKGMFKSIFIASFVSFVVFSPVAFLIIEKYELMGAFGVFAIFSTADFCLKIFLSKGSNIFSKITSLDNIKESSKMLASILAKSTTTLIIASFINALVFFLVRMMLSSKEGGFVHLAEFDVAFQFIIIEMLVLNTVTTVSLSHISRRINGGLSSGKVFISNLAIVLAIAVIMTLVCYLSAPFLLGLFGSSYNSEVLEVMCFIIIFYSFAIALNRYMIARNKSIVLFYVSLFSALAMYGYSVLNVEDAFSLAYAYIIYYAVSICVYLFFILKGVYFDNKEA